MNQSTKININSFRRISAITVGAVYFLILVGGIVRSTGSGMGCPDWPKCFGRVVPPTSVDQLPENYQDIYLEKRIAKNERFVSMIEKMGFSELGEEISNDKSILVEEEFNPVKTWIEYLNRLVGVVIGLLILVTLWRSLKLWSVDKKIPVLAFVALFLVLLTAWIGSIVVSTNLLPWMITLHMLLALALVLVLLYLNFRANLFVSQKRHNSRIPNKLVLILFLGAILMLVQIVLGTQVREKIDQVAYSLGNLLRDQWVVKVGIQFLVHRSFSLVILGLHLLYFFWAFNYTTRNSRENVLSQLLVLMLLLEIGTGIGMAYFGIPAYLQPIHLLIGTLLVGIQFVLILELKNRNKVISHP